MDDLNNLNAHISDPLDMNVLFQQASAQLNSLDDRIKFENKNNEKNLQNLEGQFNNESEVNRGEDSSQELVQRLQRVRSLEKALGVRDSIVSPTSPSYLLKKGQNEKSETSTSTVHNVVSQMSQEEVQLKLDEIIATNKRIANEIAKKKIRLPTPPASPLLPPKKTKTTNLPPSRSTLFSSLLTPNAMNQHKLSYSNSSSKSISSAGAWVEPQVVQVRPVSSPYRKSSIPQPRQTQADSSAFNHHYHQQYNYQEQYTNYNRRDRSQQQQQQQQHNHVAENLSLLSKEVEDLKAEAEKIMSTAEKRVNTSRIDNYNIMSPPPQPQPQPYQKKYQQTQLNTSIHSHHSKFSSATPISASPVKIGSNFIGAAAEAKKRAVAAITPKLKSLIEENRALKSTISVLEDRLQASLEERAKQVEDDIIYNQQVQHQLLQQQASTASVRSGVVSKNSKSRRKLYSSASSALYPPRTMSAIPIRSSPLRSSTSYLNTSLGSNGSSGSTDSKASNSSASLKLFPSIRSFHQTFPTLASNRSQPTVSKASMIPVLKTSSTTTSNSSSMKHNSSMMSSSSHLAIPDPPKAVRTKPSPQVTVPKLKPVVPPTPTSTDPEEKRLLLETILALQSQLSAANQKIDTIESIAQEKEASLQLIKQDLEGSSNDIQVEGLVTDVAEEGVEKYAEKEVVVKVKTATNKKVQSQQEQVQEERKVQQPDNDKDYEAFMGLMKEYHSLSERHLNNLSNNVSSTEANHTISKTHLLPSLN